MELLGTQEFAQMEFNRNHYFMIGVVVLLLGIQVHKVDTYILNEEATAFVVERLGSGEAKVAQATDDFTAMFIPATPVTTPQKHKVKTKPWIGFALMSIGAVLVLHSFAMPRPG